MREVNAEEKTLLTQIWVNCGDCPGKGQIAAENPLVELGAVDLEAGVFEPAHQSVDGA